MGIRLIEPPTESALSLIQIKQDLRVDHNDDDAILSRTIQEATEWLERRLGVKLMPQTWEFIIDEFPTDEIRLPFGPVQSIVQVAYDHAETAIENILPSSEYTLDDVSYRVVPEPWLFPTTAWPATFEAINSVRIQFIAGHATADLVPGPMKSALRLKVRELYDGDDTTAQVDRLLWNHIQIMA